MEREADGPPRSDIDLVSVMTTMVVVAGGKVQLSLNGLTGCTRFDAFVDFNSSAAGKLLSLDGLILADPRDNADPTKSIEDLATLGAIHTHISHATKALQGNEKEEARYWLASMFHFYFERYRLHEEGWGCRTAWVHLNKMRYYAMARLYRLRELNNKELSNREMLHFKLALRDWHNLCINEDYHFMFRAEYQLEPIEEEVGKLLRGDNDTNAPLLSYFLKDEDGSRVLNRLIGGWFLGRYDWWGASRLACRCLRTWITSTRGRRWLAIGAVTTAMISSLGVWLIGWLDGCTWLQIGLAATYLLVLGILGIGMVKRTVLDLLLPRLLAAIGVGYLPLLLTAELWKIVYRFDATEPMSLGRILIIDLGALLLSFVYLRWFEVEKKLARTPNLARRKVVWRALWILVFGLVASLCVGIMILDVVGRGLARAHFEGIPSGVPGIFGEVHTPILWVFAPFALLIGVILQIFWEQTPISYPA